MAATRAQIMDAWAKWDNAEPMTAGEQLLLKTGPDGARDIPPDPQAALADAFLAAHGDKPVTNAALADLLKQQAEVFADALRPLRSRIAALEAEVKAGHARLVALEAETEESTDAD